MVAVSALGLAACQPAAELTPDVAEEILQATPRYTATKTSILHVGEQEVTAMWEKHIRGLTQLADIGLVEFKLLRAPGVMPGKVKLNLTEAGMDYAEPLPDRKDFYSIRLCTREIMGISNIETISYGTQGAIVDYVWRYGNVTPFGTVWDEDCRERRTGDAKVGFFFEPDGWRVDQ